jgi:hypothetical protein
MSLFDVSAVGLYGGGPGVKAAHQNACVLSTSLRRLLHRSIDF